MVHGKCTNSRLSEEKRKKKKETESPGRSRRACLAVRSLRYELEKGLRAVDGLSTFRRQQPGLMLVIIYISHWAHVGLLYIDRGWVVEFIPGK